MFSDLIATFYSSTIALNTLGAFLILFSGIQQRKVHYYALFVLSILTVMYQFTTWHYHSSSNLFSAIFWLKIQTSSVLLSMSAFFSVFAFWSRHQYAKKLSYAMAGWSVLLVIINVFSEFSVRYQSVTGLRDVILFNGERVSIINGVASSLGTFLHIFYVLVIFSLLSFTFNLYRKQHKTVAVLLMSTLCLSILTSYVGMNIDAGKLDFFYIAGLPFTVLTIWVCIIIAGSLDIQTRRLKVQVKKRQDLEHAMSQLAKNISSLDTEVFYQSMLEGIYDLYEFDIIFIGLEDSPGKINSLSVLKDGKPIDNFSYALEHTPCEEVMGNNVCVYKEGVEKIFPKDKLLIDMGMTGYIGMPLIGESNELLGLLVVLHGKEISTSAKMIETLEIFSHRAGSEIKRNNAEKKLRTIAYFDYTTRLPNRSKLFEVLKSQNTRNSINGENSILMLLDLDHFTEVNKSFGYDAGEFVLRELGVRLNHYSSNDIFIARNGGDEFAIVLRNINHQPISMINVHWEAIKAIIASPIMYGKRKISLNCSMGAVIFPDQTGAKFDIIRSAETALQQAKLDGRNQRFLFDPQQLASLEKNRELEEKLINAIALDDGQLYIAYQPKTTASGELVGAEALMRWQHPQDGFISPVEFIGIAENSRLINRVGEFLIVKVCQQINIWKQVLSKDPVKISINISTLHFSDDDFFPYLMKTLKSHGILPAQIEIELTESGLLTDIKKAINKLQQLRHAGFSIALDDFGTGYSSLSYLHELPIDVLKIDKSFVDNVCDKDSRELIRSIIAIGKNMQLEIVAEGTEELQQVNDLVSLGCETFQGYYFSKALPPEEFTNWVFIK